MFVRAPGIRRGGLPSWTANRLSVDGEVVSALREKNAKGFVYIRAFGFAICLFSSVHVIIGVEHIYLGLHMWCRFRHTCGFID